MGNIRHVAIRREGPEPDDFFPLPRDTFDVLVSLADQIVMATPFCKTSLNGPADVSV